MKKLVIFDLDGTLTNTIPDIEDNVNKTMRKFGFPEITADEARRFVGNGAKVLIERSLKGVMPENFNEIVDFYNESYNFCGSPKTCVYDGMTELLKELKKRLSPRRRIQQTSGRNDGSYPQIFRRRAFRLRLRAKRRRKDQARQRTRRNCFKSFERSEKRRRLRRRQRG